jgi:hypothetical protein
MHYAIFSNAGNLVASFDDEAEAYEALSRIADEEPGSADEIALFQIDDTGHPVGDAIPAARAAEAAL